MRFFTTPEGELIEESAAAQDDKRKALRSLSSPRLTTVYKRDRERDQTTELEEADGEEGESEDMSEDKASIPPVPAFMRNFCSFSTVETEGKDLRKRKEKIQLDVKVYIQEQHADIECEKHVC